MTVTYTESGSIKSISFDSFSQMAQFEEMKDICHGYGSAYIYAHYNITDSRFRDFALRVFRRIK